ncbi:MAG: 3-oxoacyl-ACP reductase FabG [Bacteriovoracaceae bacterium]|jgi:3-oxoacyl-[acyl-carrier protein] reductase|nr:3-oxoacyl-ACP reductase FabG [Bacteriovoracaceae bacterium]
MYNFENQTAIVTGGTRGIGAAVTKALLEAGATVYATYCRSDEAANVFKTEMNSFGDKLKLAKFDVSKMNECEAFFETVDDLHILVNNSGIRKDNIAASMSEDDWDMVLNINLKGTFNMSKHAVLKMMKNRYGRIINMSSIGGMLGLSGQANYAASKAGQIALSKTLSKEVAKRKITVNNVAPGFIETELIKDLPEDQVKAYKSQVPMKRFGSTDEVAHTVMFLASEKASYITGTTIEVSGGL